jgi:hypothetical protein
VGDSSRDAAAFCWLALRGHLLWPRATVAWADEQIAAAEGPADPRIIDLSLSAGGPAERVVEAVRALLPDVAPPPPISARAFRMYAALLHRRVHEGRFSEATAADLLYGLNRRDYVGAAAALGNEIWCIDEFFEDWLYGPKRGATEVRAFLKRFSTEPLPPVEEGKSP